MSIVAPRLPCLSVARFAVAALALFPALVPASDVFRRWSTVQETRAAIGHDSNVYRTGTGEISDSFAALSHEIRIARRNSLTRLEFVGEASGNRYFSERDADFLDGMVRIDAAYPNDPIDVSFWRGRAYWRRQTDSDFDAGRRLQPMSYGALVSGEWLSSPKLGFTGLIRGDIVDRTHDGYGTTRRLSVRAGVSHSWHPELRWDLDYTAMFGHSTLGAGSDSVDHVAGVRVRGKMSPKISGELFAGVRHSSFSGTNDFSDTGPNVGADVKWTYSPQFTATLNVNSDYNFNAVGTATLRTNAALYLDAAVGHGWHTIFVISPGRARYRAVANERTDQYWLLGATVEYSRTDRFFARLTGEWVSNDSEFVGGDVSRTVGKLQLGLRY